jgi:Flp pilus assembly pilin Flp
VSLVWLSRGIALKRSWPGLQAWVDRLRRFRNDETGVVQPALYLLLVTIVAIGAIAGLTAIRDSVVGELGDAAAALESIDQSYSVVINGATIVFDEDDVDDAITCLAATHEGPGDGQPPGCIEICVAAASHE